MMLLPEFLIYSKSVTANAIFLKLALTLGNFLIISMVAMISHYISSLHQRLKRVNAENISLLNGMHEGLLILSSSLNEKVKDQVLFCNRSAEKLLTRAVSYQSRTGTESGIIKPRMFQPFKITEKDDK